MGELTVVCQACRKPVAAGAGFVGVSLREIRECEAAGRAWRERHGDGAHALSDLVTLPEDVRWRSRHHACAPGADSDAYEISTSELRSWRDLARWTAHLMAKSWLPLTDWDELLRETADGKGARIAVTARSAA